MHNRSMSERNLVGLHCGNQRQHSDRTGVNPYVRGHLQYLENLGTTNTELQRTTDLQAQAVRVEFGEAGVQRQHDQRSRPFVQTLTRHAARQKVEHHLEMAWVEPK